MAEDTNRLPLPTDGNDRVIAGGVSSSDGVTPVPFEVDPLTGRLLVSSDGAAGGGLTDDELRATPIDVSLTDLPTDTYLATSVDATASGATTIVAVGGSQTLRLAYLCLSADGANSADVTATVKIGSAIIYKLSLKAGAMWARNIGAGRRYLAGAVGDDLTIELSASQTVHVNTEYEII
jgi:hypothetical protein